LPNMLGNFGCAIVFDDFLKIQKNVRKCKFLRNGSRTRIG